MAGDWDLTSTNATKETVAPLRNNSKSSHRQPSSSSLAPEIELPRHTIPNNKAASRTMASAELILGRVAMVTAFLLMANELATGQSLPHQIVSVLSLF